MNFILMMNIEKEIISQETRAAELVDVLEAIQDASSKSATSIDTPPLSRKKLAELAEDMKESYIRVFRSTTNLIPRLDTIWENMEQLAHREKIPIELLGGIITLEALSLTKKSAGIVFETGRTGVELFDEKILDSYRQTLKLISEKGIDKHMSSHMQPFMKSAKTHFNPARKTWFESKFGSKRSQNRDY